MPLLIWYLVHFFVTITSLIQSTFYVHSKSAILFYMFLTEISSFRILYNYLISFLRNAFWLTEKNSQRRFVQFFSFRFNIYYSIVICMYLLILSSSGYGYVICSKNFLSFLCVFCTKVLSFIFLLLVHEFVARDIPL